MKARDIGKLEKEIQQLYAEIESLKKRVQHLERKHLPKEKWTTASFFAGVGGIDLGFEQTERFQVVYANEFDKNAQITYEANFTNVLDKRDIQQVKPSEIKENIDVILGGFPCQAFSIAGYRKGFQDERGNLFFDLLRFIEAIQPKAIFIENVKNMVTHGKGNTFKVIREALLLNGYHIKWKVLNGKDYGNIPQNRERIYIVGFRNIASYEQFQFPDEIPLETSLRDVIDFGLDADEAFYYEAGKQPFYDQLKEVITNQNTTYQWRRKYVRENKSGVVPTLTANMGTGGHNVPLILTDDNRIRKLTPRETFLAQGYPSGFILPELANSHLYKQAGNSVVVPVVRRIAKNMAAAMDRSDGEYVHFHDDKYALVHSHIEGKFSGESKWIGFFASKKEAEQQATDSLIFSDEDYLKLVQKGDSGTFYSIVPRDE